LAEAPDWDKRMEEMRKRFEETLQNVGAIIVSGCVVMVLMIGVGAYVWFTKVEHHSSGHSSSGGIPTYDSFKRWLKDLGMTLEKFEKLEQPAKDFIWSAYKYEVKRTQ